jgi:hypothetical protein
MNQGELIGHLDLLSYVEHIMRHADRLRNARWRKIQVTQLIAAA